MFIGSGGTAAASKGALSAAKVLGKGFLKYAWFDKVKFPIYTKVGGGVTNFTGSVLGSTFIGNYKWGQTTAQGIQKAGNFIYHFTDEDEHTPQQTKSMNWFGGYLSLDDIGAMGMSGGGHDMNYLNGLSMELMNKVDFRSKNLRARSFISDTKHRLLINSHGSNQSLRQMIRNDIGYTPSEVQNLKKIGYTQEDYLWTYDPWMRKLGWEKCRDNAAYWGGVYHYMKVHDERVIKIADKTFTRDEVAAKAMKYINAADVLLTEKHRSDNINEATRKIMNPLRRQAYSHPEKTVDIVRQGLYKVGLYAGAMPEGYPQWMKQVKADDCRRYALYFISRAQAVKEAGGSRADYQALATKAWQYERASRRQQPVDKTKDVNRERNGILARCHGSNRKLRSIIISEIQKSLPSDKDLLGSKGFNKWMMKCSWGNLHRQAAMWAGALEMMRKNNLETHSFNGKVLTRREVAKRALAYCNGAMARLSTDQKGGKQQEQRKQHQQGINSRINAYKNDILRRSGGSNYQLKAIITKDFLKWGKETMSAAVPKWMGKMNWGDCHRMSAYYYGVARYIKENKLGSLVVNGKKITFNGATQLAWSYSKAAIENLGNEKLGKKFSKATGHTPTATAAPTPHTAPQRHYQPSSTSSHPSNSHRQEERSTRQEPKESKNNYKNDEDMTASSTPASESTNTVKTSQNTYSSGDGAGQDGSRVSYSSQPSLSSAPGYNFSTPGNNGWFKYLSGLGLNGFSDVTHNLGYVLAMLPDLLISIFTGKANVSLKNNLLPLSLLTMGFLMPRKSGFIKMFLMGLGGLQLLNNAGHRILGQQPTVLQGEKADKRYKIYADEPLNPRIKNPVLKPSERMLMMDIDGKPYVIGISGVPIDAYNKKALPLNVLANAVLKQFDEKTARAEESLENNLARQNAEDQTRERTAAVK